MNIQPVLQNSQNFYSPQFQGYQRTKLGKMIDEFIKTNQPSERQASLLLEKIKEFMSLGKEGKLLGGGFHGKVFKIDDKYVLKVEQPTHLYPLETPTKPNNDIVNGLKVYYGSSAILLNRFCKILKNVSSNGKHTCAGIPSQTEKKLLFYSEKCTYWNEKYLPIFANLPQKSFDALAKDFYTLNQQGKQGKYYTFDTKNPNNIVLVGKNTLRIVDDLDKASGPNQNTTTGLLNLLVNKMDLDYNAPKDLINIAQRCELIKKIILAGEKHNLPLINTTNDMVNLNCVCEEFCNYREFVQKIKEINFKYFADKNTRLEKIKKYLDKTFSPDNTINISRWDLLA